MKKNSRKLAKTWPYIRHKNFEASLRSAARKWFASRGFATHPRMDYCLERHDLWPQNIICPDVAEYIQAEQKRHLGEDYFPLHKYLHHGLSSQAMAFNLIGPLVVRKDFEPLRQCITGIGLDWPEGDVQAGFEQDDRDVFHEDAGQPTSIDVTLTGKTGSVFMEVKLAQTEFGGCSVLQSIENNSYLYFYVNRKIIISKNYQAGSIST
ncbi:MAG: PGN_0703 family putative restriction endonuclease [Thermodesulfobacteriota bacterium]